MKQITKKMLLAATLILGSNPVFAGAGHDHSHGGHGHSHAQKELNKESIKDVAKLQVKLYVLEEKLDKNWEGIEINTIEKKEFNKRMEWVVTFNNPKVVDSKKQTLYIFVDLYGNITGANFTGE